MTKISCLVNSCNCSIFLSFKDINYNTICSEEYSRQTAIAMSQLNEKNISFELIEVDTVTKKKKDIYNLM